MRQFFYIPAFTLLLITLLAVAAGELLSRPVNQTIGAAPSDIKAETVVLQTLAKESIAGWFIKGTAGHGVVLLLHGIRADRRQMLDRAKFLNRDGYSVLLIDLLAHGESTGERITFGFHEADGVNAALTYLIQRLPNEKIAVIGVSLGAASLVLSAIHPPLSAVVLESMFPTIAEAVTDRLKLHVGTIGSYFAPLLLWQLPIKVGVSAEQLQPIMKLPSLHAPVLIASGSEDHHTTFAETQRLFQAANTPKELWIVKGAAHEDLHAFDSRAYETRISTFLAKYL
ncbi:Alpha/beta superfamily hydrolase [Crenothrix polyspora]|uniref:Alpha/beta superfamily hydrolase n=1 Tax=Crenothrix polyspora TaxID=360316 RepID=A0A1R4H0M0_9GAMM|nr:alpha/beta fold hydrolase [Crenothrix polyspora]SJM89778.1 Alpha/beta superfamily hydrolase [Crenothrix polyspora]